MFYQVTCKTWLPDQSLPSRALLALCRECSNPPRAAPPSPLRLRARAHGSSPSRLALTMLHRPSRIRTRPQSTITVLLACSLLSEFLAGHISGSPPAPLTAKQRTGLPPVDFLIRNQKSLKLGAYGQCQPRTLGRQHTQYLSLGRGS